MKKIILVITMILMFSIISYGELNDSPDILEPRNGEVKLAEDTIIRWKDVANESYYLTIKDIDTNLIIVDRKHLTVNEYFLSGSLINNGRRYKISVETTSGKISTSSYSTIDIIVEDFEAPTVKKPYYGQKFIDTNVHVDWISGRNAEYYILTLKDLDSNKIIIDKADTNTTEYLIMKELLTEGHAYTVTVSSVNNGDIKSAEKTFFYEPFSLVDSPDILYPDANQKMSLEDIEVEWKAVENTLWYSLKLINDNTKAIVLDEHNIQGNSFIIESSLLTEGQAYKVEVTSTYQSGTTSDVAFFQIKSSEMTNPVVVSPKNNEEVDVYNNRLSWSHRSGADYYLVTLKDLTDDDYLLDRHKTLATYIHLDYGLLEYGHQYKIAFAAVKDDKEYWGESFFKAKESYIYSPILYHPKDKSAVELDDLKIRWRDSRIIDHYEVSLKDITDNEMIIDGIQTTDAFYILDQSNLVEGHRYNIYITSVLNGNKKSEEIEFEVAYSNFDTPILNNALSAYPHDDIVFDWNEIKEADSYLISLELIEDNLLVLDDVVVKDSRYIISKEDLEPYKQYRLKISAKGGLIEKQTSHDFLVSFDSINMDQLNAVSSWARPYVLAVNDLSILDDELFDHLIQAPQSNISRVTFARLLVTLYNKHTKPYKLEDMDKEVMFTDLDGLNEQEHKAIIKAYRLGIMNGESQYILNPHGEVSRQEMAVMLKNTYDAMYGDTSHFDLNTPSKFNDYDSIARWAQESIIFTTQLKILEGMDDAFNPHDYASHEMAFVLLKKSFDTFSSIFSNLTYDLLLNDELNSNTDLIIRAHYKNKLLGLYKGKFEIFISDPDLLKIEDNLLIPLKSGKVTLTITIGEKTVTKLLEIKL